jgi:hypothetical protein
MERGAGNNMTSATHTALMQSAACLLFYILPGFINFYTKATEVDLFTCTCWQLSRPNLVSFNQCPPVFSDIIHQFV